MLSSSESNTYLAEVLQVQKQIESDLKRNPARRSTDGDASDEHRHIVRGGVDYRITGWWRWRTVIVPPNAYVVHTRRGHEKPVNLGLGKSFRFNPYTDAFLILPAAMQTIIINARCICVERQGILVQAYVQWIIDDLETAYRRLDFSDTDDPMRIVNVQLREQAEAAIKDKVATMHIDEVLADKQPIIEELTTRLRAVAEGREKGSGLGLKIVTVQLKEAIVSSTKLWQSLQKPFRSEREQVARMAELDAERQIASRELENRRAQETAKIETERTLSKQRDEAERETYDRNQAEAARRAKLQLQMEHDAIAQRIATEQAQQQCELELALSRLEAERKRMEAETKAMEWKKAHERATAECKRVQVQAALAITEEESKASALIAEREIAQLKARREVENLHSDASVRRLMIEKLPEIARTLPAPKEMRSVSISGDSGPANQIAGLIEGVKALLEK